MDSALSYPLIACCLVGYRWLICACVLALAVLDDDVKGGKPYMWYIHCMELKVKISASAGRRA